MISVGELATALGAEAVGDRSIMISSPAEPGSARPDQIALAMDAKFAAELSKGAARAAIVWLGADWQEMGLAAAIFAPRPRYVLSGISQAFDRPPVLAPGIHPSAVIDPTARLGADVSVGAFVFIGAGVMVGAGSRILHGVTIAEDATIGQGALLHSGVRIGARVSIGDRFVAQPGAVIGADGFSFVTPTMGTVEEARQTGAVTGRDQNSYVRINSLGSVVIGTDVEIGANSCIDRGTIANTTIGDGTKIDNLVQIGHNVRVGSTCLLCGQSGIAGSAQIGDRVVIGGKASIADHLRIGSNVIITGNSGVASHVPDNRIMMGYPAVRMDQNVAMYKALRRLPRLLDKLISGQ